MLLSRFSLATMLLLHPCSMLLGNDGAAEIALGGIRLKQERRVALVKERLFISKKKVRVEYEFVNESDSEVATEIAFPIPDYHLDLGNGWSPIEDFKVWVNGVDYPYQTEARALVGGKEVTSLLNETGVHIASFGDFKEGSYTSNTPSQSQMDSLPKQALDRLTASGALEWADPINKFLPDWTVKKTYHWTQKFPPKAVVRIAHEYTPIWGHSAALTLETIRKPLKGWHNESANPGCPDAGFVKSFMRTVTADHKRNPDGLYANQDSLPALWVSYILTTANTWKTPIRDFELLVERSPGELVTFCWDGPIERLGADTFRARVKDFIPSKELTVYFF